MEKKIAVLTKDHFLQEMFLEKWKTLLDTESLSKDFSITYPFLEQSNRDSLTGANGLTQDCFWVISDLQSLSQAESGPYLENAAFLTLLLEERDEEQVQEIGTLFSRGMIDDVMLFPFGSLDVLTRLYRFKRDFESSKVETIIEDVRTFERDFRTDYEFLKSIHKGHRPKRLPDIPGFKFHSRYFAGERAGGDFFDLAEVKDSSSLALIMTDSSSYGLSSQVHNVLFDVGFKLSRDESKNCIETLKKIHHELFNALHEENKLSIFYGLVSKKDLRLRYVQLGETKAIRVKKNGDYEVLERTGGAISQASHHGLNVIKESVLQLEPGDRIVVLSDGVKEELKELGDDRFAKIADETDEFLNEMSLDLQSEFRKRESRLPVQDCTILIAEIAERFLRQVA